ncbi:hypothetical protein OTB20_29535 [Streptomyces sp. H27-H1]|uniref:hypothetical protein n=1 Tax=Streptomyces sp. H27-H1 TaxID=2996461 RepID=UPI00226F66C4|nr:hypothetical protein [Streptomyces sp. H27-H1]MCY0930257.1 hypothetical protein [Streptomyces sp. H27-H1]
MLRRPQLQRLRPTIGLQRSEKTEPQSQRRSVAPLEAALVLPASLARLGHKAARKNENTRPEQGWWHHTALRMMRRPLLYGIPALVVLLLGPASPVLGLTFGVPGAQVLPRDVSSRVVQQQILDNFAAEEMSGSKVLRTDQAGTDANRSSIGATAATALSQVSGIHQVDALTGSYAKGQKIAEPGDSSRRFAGERSTWYSMVATHRTVAQDIDRAHSEIRSVAAKGAEPGSVKVGGYPAPSRASSAPSRSTGCRWSSG